MWYICLKTILKSLIFDTLGNDALIHEVMMFLFKKELLSHYCAHFWIYISHFFRKILSQSTEAAKYGVISGPYFPAFGPEITPYLDTFRVVLESAISHCLKDKIDKIKYCGSNH